MKNSIKKAVVLSAGKGIRIYPLTKIFPKTMLPIGEKPALHVLLEELVDAGIKEVLIIVGHNATIIKKYFSNIEYDNFFYKLKFLKITYKYQRNLNGTGNAVNLAKQFVGNDNFFVAFADDITNPKDKVCQQLINVFLLTKKNIMATKNVDIEEAYKYGIIKTKNFYLDKYLIIKNSKKVFINKKNKKYNNCKINNNYKINNIKFKNFFIKYKYYNNLKKYFNNDKIQLYKNLFLVKKIIEKPNHPTSTLINFGRYVFTPEIFKKLKNLTNQKNNEKYLTEALERLIKENKLLAYKFQGKSYDIGSIHGYIETFKEINK